MHKRAACREQQLLMTDSPVGTGELQGGREAARVALRERDQQLAQLANLSAEVTELRAQRDAALQERTAVADAASVRVSRVQASQLEAQSSLDAAAARVRGLEAELRDACASNDRLTARVLLLQVRVLLLDTLLDSINDTLCRKAPVHGVVHRVSPAVSEHRACRGPACSSNKDCNDRLTARTLLLQVRLLRRTDPDVSASAVIDSMAMQHLLPR
jgi:hypothetical protein